MVDPRSELDALLARLRLLPAAEEALAEDFPFDAAEQVETREGADGALDEGAAQRSAMIAAEEPREGVEVSAVRTEIEATLRLVQALTRAGQLEPELQGDVIFVLDALTRPMPTTPRVLGARHAAAQREGEREWQLASAAAVLRFCRIVTHLTNGVTLRIEP